MLKSAIRKMRGRRSHPRQSIRSRDFDLDLKELKAQASLACGENLPALYAKIDRVADKYYDISSLTLRHRVFGINL